jgi:T3SS negative regulator,GrlR
MAVDGFWILQFKGAEVYGSGVAVLANGKLFGGESGFYYIGTYEAEGKMLKARVVIRNFDPAVQSGFGIVGDYEMDVSVVVQDDNMTGTAMIANQPQHSLGIRLTKKANL